MLIPVALVWVYSLTAPVTGDSARVEAGRLIVEPIGISFRIPPTWLDTSVKRLGGAGGCDRHSASAKAVNTDPVALRSMTGPSTYFGDQYYSAMADSLFPVSELSAHVGARGWRECDNSEADLQVRVYVNSRTPEELGKRLRSIHLSPYPGYSQPVVAAPQDSSGWRIQRADWEFNCGDCIFAERLEIYSRRIRDRTVSLVFMYSPSTWDRYNPALADMRAILSSVKLAPDPGA
jgi:hypothetical protein